MPPLLTITYHLFLQIAVELLTYRLLWPLFRRLAQVQVVAMMVAGFLLGPSVLGWIWPAAQRWLFPTKLTIGAETITHPNLVAIYVIGQLGLGSTCFWWDPRSSSTSSARIRGRLA